MIDLIGGLPDSVLGLEAKGEVTGEDYERVLIPALESKLGRHKKIRLLYVLGSEFDGYSAGAIWEDTRVGMSHPLSWERIAVVTDDDSYRRLVRGFGFMVPGEVRVFAGSELDAARAWVTEDA
jgi:hypothetical protein